MPSSNTFVFSPEIIEICEEAFERCGIDPAKISHRHAVSARRSLNYMFTEWATRGVHLWAVKTGSITILPNTASYTVPSDCYAVLDAYIRDANNNDIYVNAVGREDYFSLVNKTTVGDPSLYWFERSVAPKIHLWPVPNVSKTFVYNYLQYLELATTANENAGLPQLWQEAIVAGLAARLAEKYAPEREPSLFQKAELRYKEANQEDRERHQTRFVLRYRMR